VVPEIIQNRTSIVSKADGQKINWPVILLVFNFIRNGTGFG